MTGPINRVLFLGSKLMGLRVLEAIWNVAPETIVGIVTVDDSADTRSVKRLFCDFCTENDIPMNVVSSQRQADRIIRQFSPELCIVAGWYWLIRKTVLKAVPGGFLGLHNSLLPKYRGAAPLVWAIMTGDSEVGITLFKLDIGVDDGEILAARAIHIAPDEYIGNVLSRLEDEAEELFGEVYPRILDRAIRGEPQDPALATYGAPRRPEDGLVDWHHSSREIYNFIRSQSQPYTGAFTYLGKSQLTLWGSNPVDLRYFGTPGQVVRAHDGGILVVCGDAKPLRLGTVTLEGQSECDATEVVHPYRTRLGRH